MNVSMKKGLLAMVGAVALAGAGTAQAADQYAIYKGTTTLTTSTGATAVCWLTIAGTIDENGLVTIKAAGARPGDYPTCSAIYLGNIPWTGTLSNCLGRVLCHWIRVHLSQGILVRFYRLLAINAEGL